MKTTPSVYKATKHSSAPKATNRITVDLPREDSERLKAIAKEKGMLFQAFIRSLLQQAL